MKENFIRSFPGPLNKSDSNILIKEFDQMEHKSAIRLSVDGSVIGESVYIENGTDAETLLLEHTSKVVTNYIKELGVPFHFKSLNDEGYQIQRWDNSVEHWVSPLDHNKLNRALQVIIVLSSKRGSLINFRHHGAFPLKTETTLVFPALFTHTYNFNFKGGCYLISTGVRTNTGEEDT